MLEEGMAHNPENPQNPVFAHCFENPLYRLSLGTFHFDGQKPGFLGFLGFTLLDIIFSSFPSFRIYIGFVLFF